MRFGFSNLGLRTQVAAIVAAALLSLSVIAAVYVDGTSRRDAIMAKAEAASAFQMRMQNLEIDLLQLRRAEKNFLTRADMSYVREHAEVRGWVDANLAAMAGAVGGERRSELAAAVGAIAEGTKAYTAAFDRLVAARTGLGLDPNSGLEGRLRKGAHDIEKAVDGLGDPRVQVTLLQMRRHEKDYMLRHDAKYVADFEKRTAEMRTLVQGIDAPLAMRVELDRSLDIYLRGFLAWVEGDRESASAEKAVMKIHREMEPVIDGAEASVNSQATAAKAEASAVTTATEQRMEWAFGVVAVMLTLLSLAIARAIAGPVCAMTAVMGRLAEGDHDVAVAGGDKSNEIGRMARAVTVFRDNARERARLEQLQAGEKQRAEAERRRAAMDMADRFEQAIGGVVGMVDTAAMRLQKAAQTLSSSAEETSAQSASVAAASEQASANVATVAAATEELSTTVREISRQVEQSVEIAAKAVGEANATDGRVRGLSTAADRIGNIVGLINEIAAKTNLLALNATIEAARAGEAGRGFAVVANEVKGLAEQTAKATAEIGSNITAIQTSTGEAAEALAAIGRTIGRMNGIATSIASAVEEQGVTTEEIARNVQQAAAGAGAVTSNITEVTRAAADSSAASALVLDAATDLAAQAETMRRTVSDFLATIRAA